MNVYSRRRCLDAQIKKGLLQEEKGQVQQKKGKSGCLRESERARGGRGLQFRSALCLGDIDTRGLRTHASQGRRFQDTAQHQAEEAVPIITIIIIIMIPVVTIIHD